MAFNKVVPRHIDSNVKIQLDGEGRDISAAYLIPKTLVTVSNICLSKSQYRDKRRSISFTNGLGIIKVPLIDGNLTVDHSASAFILTPAEEDDLNLNQARWGNGNGVKWKQIELSLLTYEYINTYYHCATSDDAYHLCRMARSNTVGKMLFNTLCLEVPLLGTMLSVLSADETRPLRFNWLTPSQFNSNILTSARGGALYQAVLNDSKQKEALLKLADKIKADPDIDLEAVAEVDLLVQSAQIESNYKTTQRKRVVSLLKTTLKDKLNQPEFRGWEGIYREYRNGNLIWVGLQDGKLAILPPPESLKTYSDGDDNFYYTIDAKLQYVAVFGVDAKDISEVNFLTTDINLIKQVFESHKCEVVEYDTSDTDEVNGKKLISDKLQLVIANNVYVSTNHIKPAPPADEYIQVVDFTPIFVENKIKELREAVKNITEPDLTLFD